MGEIKGRLIGIEIRREGVTNDKPWTIYSYKLETTNGPRYVSGFDKLGQELGRTLTLEIEEKPNPTKPEYPFLNLKKVIGVEDFVAGASINAATDTGVNLVKAKEEGEPITETELVKEGSYSPQPLTLKERGVMVQLIRLGFARCKHEDFISTMMTETGCDTKRAEECSQWFGEVIDTYKET